MKRTDSFKISFALKALLILAAVRLILSASTLHIYLSNENYIPGLWKSTYEIRIRRKTIWGSNIVEIEGETTDDLVHRDAKGDKQLTQRHAKDSHATAATNVSKGSFAVILVLSARGNFAARKAIRETWASQVNNVVFLIGSRGCLVPVEYRKDFRCAPRVRNASEVNSSKVLRLVESTGSEQLMLEAEARRFGDVVLLPLVDTYRRLPRKLKLGYKWALEHTNASWFVKVDDDFYVHVLRLERFLHNHRAKGKVLGRIAYDVGVDRRGKWAEHHWAHKRYPPFPFGSCGHAVSRDVAEDIVRTDPYEYQGEDTSLGIWLSEREDIQMNTSMVFTNRGRCQAKEKIVVGHQIAPDLMRSCHKYIHSNRSKA